jgi:hypothetical protein
LGATNGKGVEEQSINHKEMKMQRARGAFALAAVLAVVLAATGAVGAQNYFHETYFVGANPIPPITNEMGAFSVWEQNGVFSGALFADFCTATNPATAIHDAVLDSSDQRFLPWLFHSTGSLVVAKTSGGWPGFETYSGLPAGTNFHPTHRNMIGSQEMWSASLPWTYATATASLQPIDAMDIGNGYLPAGTAGPTDFVITAETFQNTIWLGAYTLTNNQGLPIRPFLVNAQNTGRPGPCLGLTTSNGKWGVAPNSLNDIVFVDGTMVVNGMPFDIITQAFGPLNTVNYQVPWNLSTLGQTIAGIWISQHTGGAGVGHNVGISIPNPAGGPGNFCILFNTLLVPPPGARTTIQGFGGGPICHIPTGSAVVPQASPSFWALVGKPPSGATPLGWYVATPPQAVGAPWTLEAIDCNGVRPGLFIYNYPANFQPNGNPLSDPGAIGFVGNPALEPGFVWVPEVDPGTSTFQMTLLRGAPRFGGINLGTVWHANVAGANFPPLGGGLLPRSGQPWPVQQFLPDAKVNSKADYGLYAGGY